MNRGKMMHDAAELFVKGERDDLIPELNNWKRQIHKARELYEAGLAFVEVKWGIDINWQPVEDFIKGKGLWGRLIADLGFFSEDKRTLDIVDYKSGKSKNKEVVHGAQLFAYASAAIERYPQVSRVNVAAWYLDERGKKLERSFSRRQIMTDIRPAMERRALRLTECVSFRPNPSKFSCNFCNFRDVCKFSASPSNLSDDD